MTTLDVGSRLPGLDADARRDRLARARLYLCTDARRAGRPRRVRRRRAARAASTSSSCGRRGSEAARRARRARGARRRVRAATTRCSRSTTAPTSRSPPAPTSCTSGRTTCPVPWARRVVGDDVLIGRSTHDADAGGGGRRRARRRLLLHRPVLADPDQAGPPGAGPRPGPDVAARGARPAVVRDRRDRRRPPRRGGGRGRHPRRRRAGDHRGRRPRGGRARSLRRPPAVRLAASRRCSRPGAAQSSCGHGATAARRSPRCCGRLVVGGARVDELGACLVACSPVPFPLPLGRRRRAVASEPSVFVGRRTTRWSSGACRWSARRATPTDVPESPPESGCPAADSTAKLASRPIAKMLAATPAEGDPGLPRALRRGRSTAPASWVGSSPGPRRRGRRSTASPGGGRGTPGGGVGMPRVGTRRVGSAARCRGRPGSGRPSGPRGGPSGVRASGMRRVGSGRRTGRPAGSRRRRDRASAGPQLLRGRAAVAGHRAAARCRPDGSRGRGRRRGDGGVGGLRDRPVGGRRGPVGGLRPGARTGRDDDRRHPAASRAATPASRVTFATAFATLVPAAALTTSRAFTASRVRSSERW